eukprot:Em0009g1108a
MADNSNENVLSTLLSKEENDLVVTILGNRKQTKATTVIQMFHANPNKTQWTKFSTGVVCFVKDNIQRSYYIRLLDLWLKKVTYEQEIYDQFTYKKHSPCFHSFPGDKFMVGMNFADKDEAVLFSQAVDSKITRRRNTIKKPSNEIPQQVSRPPNNELMGERAIQRTGAQRKKRKEKLSKADISAPSNFQHLAHVGIDANTGNFDINNISSDWKQLLDTVGVTHEQLKDKKTAEFIINFVEKRGGIEEANRQLEESKRKAPPPPPARKAMSDQSPSSQLLPPPSPRVSSHSPATKRGNAPPPPPNRGTPSSLSTAPPAPPPPPPPPPIGRCIRNIKLQKLNHNVLKGVPAPPPPPPPPPLPSLSSKDTHLTVSASAHKRSSAPPEVSDARSNLLSSIRAGMQLRAVEERETPAAQVSDLDGMAGALARALASRSNVMQTSAMADDTSDRIFLSKLLSEHDNETVLDILGHENKTKATAVVEIFLAYPDSSRWTRFASGVACVVKDDAKRSYYIRLLDLGSKSVQFEQKLHRQLVYSKDTTTFHYFELPGEELTVGLSFSDEDEAHLFGQVIESKITCKSELCNSQSDIRKPYSGDSSHASHPLSTDLAKYPADPTLHVPQAAGGKSRLTKADISNPSNLAHLSHIGFDYSTGTFEVSNISSKWKQRLDTLGVTREQQDHTKTAEFTCSYVEEPQEANRQLEDSNRMPPVLSPLEMLPSNRTLAFPKKLSESSPSDLYASQPFSLSPSSTVPPILILPPPPPPPLEDNASPHTSPPTSPEKAKDAKGKDTIHFQHLACLGIDPQTGDVDMNNISSEWKQLLDTVGVTHEQLKDNTTAEFIYNFVQERGGIKAANRQLEESKRSSIPPPEIEAVVPNQVPPAPPSPRVPSADLNTESTSLSSPSHNTAQPPSLPPSTTSKSPSTFIPPFLILPPPPAQPPPPARVSASPHTSPPPSPATKRKPKMPKAKIPSNFHRHLMNNISSEWKQLLDTVGVTHEQLKDNTTAEFIYNFVQERGGIEAANRQLEESKRSSIPPPEIEAVVPNQVPPAPPSPRVPSADLNTESTSLSSPSHNTAQPPSLPPSTTSKSPSTFIPPFLILPPPPAQPPPPE